MSTLAHHFAVRLAAGIMLLVLGTVVGLGLVLGEQTAAQYDADLRTRLLGDARAVALVTAPLLAEPMPLTETQRLARDLGAAFPARVTLIALDGTVVGDSDDDPRLMENHATRPEVQAARQGPAAVGESTRFSQTLGRDLRYLAVPILARADPTRVIGVARVALPLTAVNAARAALWANLLAAAAAISLPALLLVVLLARTISRPVTELRAVTRRIGAGDLAARAGAAGRDELGELGREVNRMAERLADLVQRRTRERNEMAAVLAHMHDGILITDSTGEITSLNPAAARLLGVSPERAPGHSLIEVARDHDLYAALHTCLAQPGPSIQVEVRLGAAQVVATCTAVPPAAGQRVTGLVVLQDVTELRRLERARRDFIANISHELRAPLAAIKLLVETLETALTDDPAAAPRFLQQIAVELDGMTQLVRELLELARIESGLVALQFAAVPVEPLLAGAADRLRPLAERKQITVQVDAPAALPPVRADAGRIEQVLLNLVHNAIKFTPPGGRITLRARPHPEGVVLCVEDTGQGIEPEDLPRVFERFYKGDKARAAGGESGTGLGLAIAKHLVQTHSGRIWATSTPGQGATFCFTLPPAPPTGD
jgi:two-component system phosphate regulon sensor histidine kinase PhoR